MPSQIDLPHYTYSDYLHWEGRWEIIEGIAHAISPAPSVNHQKVSQEIARLLGESMDQCEQCHALLPVDWKITEDTIVQPDNLIVNCATGQSDRLLSTHRDLYYPCTVGDL